MSKRKVGVEIPCDDSVKALKRLYGIPGVIAVYMIDAITVKCYYNPALVTEKILFKRAVPAEKRKKKYNAPNPENKAA